MAALGSSCGIQDLPCVVVRYFVVVHRFSSRGPWGPEHEGAQGCGVWLPESELQQFGLAGSPAAARGLSCSEACGILVPPPGIEPPSPALQHGLLTTGPPGKSLMAKF